MNKHYVLSLLVTFIFLGKAQNGYDIRINFKGCPDSTVYLARYYWDQVPISDSCVKIKNGKIRFKGDMALDKGVYILANQNRSNFYIQFIVDNNQNFTINLDNADIVNTQKSDEKQNDQFFSYVSYMTNKNKELADTYEKAKGKSKEDSTKMVNDKGAALNGQILKFETDFMNRNKGTFVYDLIKMKTEVYATDIPKASNGRPDSLYQYFYYKNHYFDNMNMKDDRTMNTPFFAERVKKYFDQMVPQHPDSVIKELDLVLGKCVPGSNLFNTLVGHFTYKFEQNKTISFDNTGKCNTYEKVFIHLADKYIVSGKTDGYYSAETIVKIKDRVDILRNLQPGVKVPDLFMIDTTYGRQVLKMGFDTARSSESVTYLYTKNSDKLSKMYRTMYDIKAKYTVLVFWAADCGHCQTEVPKLHKELQALKGKVDLKVYAVQTKEELFDTWRKFLIEKDLNDFVHVFDPVHINALTLKDRFDINATPVIYLLDRDKKIIGKKIGSEQVIDIVNNLERIEKNLK
jgi:thiol-disulfide isomerase/thioredoxin